MAQIRKNLHDLALKYHFSIFCFWNKSSEFLSAKYVFDKSQILFKKKLLEISLSTRCLYKNIQSTKSIKMDIKHTNNSILWNERHDFHDFGSWDESCDFSRAKFF